MLQCLNVKMNSVRLIPNYLFSYKWDWNRDSPTWTISHTDVNTVHPDSTVADPKKGPSCTWTCGNTTTFQSSLANSFEWETCGCHWVYTNANTKKGPSCTWTCGNTTTFHCSLANSFEWETCGCDRVYTDKTEASTSTHTECGNTGKR